MLKLRKNKKGFTLVELIVVIAIMAVLAGVVAGVTVSQLNKQTNKTGSTQARTIADYISTVTLTGENEEGELKLLTEAGAFDAEKVKKLIEDQYSASSIPVKYATAAGTANGEITVFIADGKVNVSYKPKGSGANTVYIVGTDGVVSVPSSNG